MSLANTCCNLRSDGFQIAICTSDSREGTEEFLDRERLTPLVDAVVCGDDATSKPKPDPHNASELCRMLNVRPSDTVMVGDTPADTLMGQQVNIMDAMMNCVELFGGDVEHIRFMRFKCF